MTEREDPPIIGDQPVLSASKDFFGFTPAAVHIAKMLSDETLTDGFVLGLEGPWGSGKTTLLNLIKESLENVISTKMPIICSFSPWLIGTRESLLREFLQSLVSAIQANPEARNPSSAIANAAQAIKQYGGRFLSIASDTLIMAGDHIQIPGIKSAGTALGIASNIMLDVAEQSLETQKHLTAVALKKLTTRIVIFIDDIDRLDPIEIIEVFWLVRTVGELPNVVYMLCYDRDIVSNAIKKCGYEANGESYLAKIIQTSIPMIQADPLLLEGHFRENVYNIFNVKSMDSVEFSILERTIDHMSPAFLRTPRDGIRVLDRLRVVWPALRTYASPADVVWIELVRNKLPSLHEWLRGYLSVMAAIAEGAEPPEGAVKRNTIKQLHSIYLSGIEIGIDISLFLPGLIMGISPLGFGSEENYRIYEITDKAVEYSITWKRISSPDHYAFYFDMMRPASGYQRDDIEKIKYLIKHPADAISPLLISYSNEKVPGGNTLGQILHRANTVYKTELDVATGSWLIRRICDGKIRGQRDRLGLPVHWRHARALIRTLCQHEIVTFEADLLELFRQSKDIEFLSNIFATGRSGDDNSLTYSPDSQEPPVIDGPIRGKIFEILRDRLSREFNMAQILQLEYPSQVISAMFFILPASDFSCEINNYIMEDGHFLDFFECLSKEPQAVGRRLPMPFKLKFSDLTDIGAARTRIIQLSKADGPYRQRAVSLRDTLPLVFGRS